MRPWAFWLVLLCACGSRSGVPLDEGEAAPQLDDTPAASVCLGTPGEAVVLGKANPFRPIAVDGTHIYFSQTLSPDESPQIWLMRMPRAGGAPEKLYVGNISEMVLSGGHVIILRGVNPGLGFELLRVPRAGGAPETLATGPGEPTSLATVLDGSVVMTARYGQAPHGLWRWYPGGALKHVASLDGAVQVTTAANAAYVVHQSPLGKNSLTQVHLSDGSTTLLLDDVLHSSSLAHDGGDLFSSASFRVDRFALGPSSATRTTLGKGVGALADLAVDDTHVYFADVGVYHDDLPPPKPKDVPGSIRRVPRQGGAVEMLSDEGRDVGALAIDDCHVYWTSRRGLVRMRKP